MNTLNEKDIDQLTMMLVLNLLIAERCVQMTELFYHEQLRKSKDYEDLVKTKGKAFADMACAGWIHKTFRREAKWRSTASCVSVRTFAERLRTSIRCC